MATKKLSISIYENFLEAFSTLCEENGFKVNKVIADSIAAPNEFIEFAIGIRDKAFRAEKIAQIVKLRNELGLSDTDLKKLMKDSEQAASSPAKEEKVIESRRAHKGTYEDEDVVWEVDKYGDGYFCHTKDGKSHKKDVNGNIIS